MSTDRKPCDPLTLCVVNYNGERYLEESLGAAFIQKERFEEIILIDNASEDRSLEIIRDRFPMVKVIQPNKNRGPAVARNVGFKAASYDLILFIDNDVSLDPDCPSRLVEALKDNPCAAVAMPRVLYAYNKSTIQYDGANGHFLGLMGCVPLIQSVSRGWPSFPRSCVGMHTDMGSHAGAWEPES